MASVWKGSKTRPTTTIPSFIQFDPAEKQETDKIDETTIYDATDNEDQDNNTDSDYNDNPKSKFLLSYICTIV